MNMNPSTFLSMLFTLFFILISHAFLSASSLKLYEIVCKEAAPYTDDCLKALDADPRIPSANDYNELSLFILNMALKNSTDAQNYIKEKMKTNPSPAIKECATVDYAKVVGSFKNSLTNLLWDPKSANRNAREAAIASGSCESALAGDPGIYFDISQLDIEMSLFSQISELATNHLLYE